MTRKLETPGFVYITADIVHVTRDAVKIHDGKREAWLPKSQIEDPQEFQSGEAAVEFLLPEWLARDKNLL